MSKKVIALAIIIVLVVVILLFMNAEKINKAANADNPVDRSCVTDSDCALRVQTGCKSVSCQETATEAVNKNWKPVCIIPEGHLYLFTDCIIESISETKCISQICTYIPGNKTK